jgi:hypothetical protein
MPHLLSLPPRPPLCGGALSTVVDPSGFGGVLSGSATPIATAATNTAFRGVALAPASAVPPIVPEFRIVAGLPLSAVGLLAVFTWRRRPRATGRVVGGRRWQGLRP